MPLTEERVQWYHQQWPDMTEEQRRRARTVGVPDPPPTPRAEPSELTPRPPASAAPSAPPSPPTPQSQTDVAGLAQWLPGMEWMHALPQETQESVVLEAPHIAKMGAALGINLAGTMAGGAVGAATGPFAPAAIPLGATAGSYAARQLNTRLGLEEPGLGGDVMALAGPWVGSGVKGLKDVGKWAIRQTPAGKAMQTAQEATTTAERSYLESLQSPFVTGEMEVSRRDTLNAIQKAQTAHAERVREAQAVYTEAVATARRETAQATQEAQQAWATKHMERYSAALDKAQEAQAAYRRATQDYRGAIAAQHTAVARARGIPGTFAPSEDYQTLYADFATEFGPRPATMTDGRAAAARVLSQLGGHFESLQNGRMQAIATEMLSKDTATVTEVHQYLKDLGPLTRSTNSTVRGAAKQLYAGLQDSLETVAGAPDALRKANWAARREFALDDLERVIRRAVHTGNDGLPRLSAGTLVDRGRVLGEENPLFRGSFTREEWDRLMGNLAALTGQPTIPKPPVQPGPIRVADPGPLPGEVAPKPVTAKVVEPFAWPERHPPSGGRPPSPAELLMPKRAPWGRWAAEVALPAAELAMQGHVGPWGVVGSAAAMVDATAYGVSKLLLQPHMQPLLRRLIQPSGHIDPRALALFNAAVRSP